MVPVVRRAAMVPVVWRPVVGMAMRAPHVWAHRGVPVVPEIARVRPAPGPVATAREGMGRPRADPPGELSRDGGRRERRPVHRRRWPR